MALTGIQIFKLTPKKNCKECGSPTCMAFSMKVASGAVSIDKCPHMSDEALATLSEATAPPMKTIKVGAGDAFQLGGETVLFRHEKTLVSKNLYAVTVTAANADEKLAAIPKVDYVRIGERMYVEMVNVVYTGEGADAYAALVQKAAALPDRALILKCDDVDAAKAALAVCKDAKPILNGANPANYEAMNAVATEAGVTLGVTADDIDALYDTIAALEKLGNKNLVFDCGSKSAKDVFSIAVQMRRAALKEENRT